jgi:hypothetical protein
MLDTQQASPSNSSPALEVARVTLKVCSRERWEVGAERIAGLGGTGKVLPKEISCAGNRICSRGEAGRRFVIRKFLTEGGGRASQQS